MIETRSEIICAPGRAAEATGGAFSDRASS